jgi:tRNA A37 N6-isopentenylltransferase MiaA
VAVRPYRYPQLLKDKIERQCEDMLQQGIIRECTSAYSSPVLLVKKADNSWRFCVDYCELNHKTVKDQVSNSGGRRTS